MEQREVWKNITGTAFVVGLAISSMSFNDTQIINSFSDFSIPNYGSIDEKVYNTASSLVAYGQDNVYVEHAYSFFDEENLMGRMREATAQESESISNYVKSISKKTGVNFFDVC